MNVSIRVACVQVLMQAVLPASKPAPGSGDADADSDADMPDVFDLEGEDSDDSQDPAREDAAAYVL